MPKHAVCRPRSRPLERIAGGGLYTIGVMAKVCLLYTSDAADEADGW